MSVFLLTIILLTPLAWVVLNGPQPSLVEIAGGSIALGWLAMKNQLMALRYLLPFFAAGMVYTVSGYIASDRSDLVMYSSQMALLLMFYGLPTGLCLRRLAAEDEGEQVAIGLVVFALCMAAVSLVILRLPEVQRITGETQGTFQRTNGDENDITYLRFFHISNIIIGVIPFTLFALAGLPAALTARRPALLALLGLSVGVAVYANVLIATRTALLAGAASGLIVMLLSWSAIPRRRWLLFGGALTATGLFAMLYFRQNIARFDYLLERFAEAGSDGRLPIWSEAMGLVARFPQGQVAGNMQTHSWAHNLFLDVGLTNGWVAIGAVLMMFTCAYWHVARRILAGGFFRSSANLVMLGWLLSTSLAGMIQPPQPVFLTVLHLACAYFAPVRRAPLRQASRVERAPSAPTHGLASHHFSA